MVDPYDKLEKRLFEALGDLHDIEEVGCWVCFWSMIFDHCWPTQEYVLSPAVAEIMAETKEALRRGEKAVAAAKPSGLLRCNIVVSFVELQVGLAFLIWKCLEYHKNPLFFLRSFRSVILSSPYLMMTKQWYLSYFWFSFFGFMLVFSVSRWCYLYY